MNIKEYRFFGINIPEIIIYELINVDEFKYQFEKLFGHPYPIDKVCKSQFTGYGFYSMTYTIDDNHNKNYYLVELNRSEYKDFFRLPDTTIVNAMDDNMDEDTYRVDILNYIAKNSEIKLFRKTIATFQEMLFKYGIGNSNEFQSMLIDKLKADSVIDKLSNDELSTVCDSLSMNALLDILKLIRDEKKIQAIKRHREETGESLKDSKRKVEILMDNEKNINDYIINELG